MTVWPAMVTEPLRDVPVLAATESTTQPLPVPGLPEATSIHPAALDALQEHVEVVVTATEDVAPADPTEIASGDTEYEQEGAALCEMVTVWPATVTVPVRALPVLVEIVTVRVPPPVPPAPGGTLSHETLLEAAQEQLLPAVTLRLAVEAPAPTDRLVGETV